MTSQKPTISQIARELDLNPSTVSLALRQSPLIAQKTRARVNQKAAEMGYMPNRIASALRSGRTRRLGVVVPFASDSHYAALLDAMHDEARQQGCQMEILFHKWQVDDEAVMLRQMAESQVEGVALVAASGTADKMDQPGWVPGFNLPLVIIGSDSSGLIPRFLRGCVATDHFSGSRELGHHLLEMGHREIAMLFPAKPTASGGFGDRAAGLSHAVREVPGARLHTIYLDDESRADGGAELVRKYGSSASETLRVAEVLIEKLLKTTPAPTAVITTHEMVAHQLLGVLSEKGIRVPDDVSVACYGSSILPALGMMPLTCVELPIAAIARQAVQLLLESSSVAESNGPQTRFLAPRLCIRRSVSRLPGAVESSVFATAD